MKYLTREGIRTWSRLVIIATVAICGLVVDAPLLAQAADDGHWVGTWATATAESATGGG